jgi:predicted PurR-regulated permease PerM
MSPRKNITVNITNRTFARAILWGIIAILAFRFMGRVSHVLTLIFGAFFLALALNPVVVWMQEKLNLKSRVRATALTYLTVVLVLTAFFALVIPPLVTQTRTFIRQAPKTVQNFQQQDNSLARAARRYHIDDKLTKSAKTFTSHYASFGTKLLNTGKRVAEAIVSALAVLVLTFMMLVEGPRWLDLLLGTVPETKRPRYRKNTHRMYKAVTGFVNGQVILAVVAGSFAFLALEITGHILNVQTNPAALAGIVAVFGIIPLFGNPIAATIVILVSLLNSLTLAIVMLVYFIIYFFIENHTFQPYLQSKLQDLTPLTVFVAALLGIGFGGILGAIIAIPAASTVKILIEDHFDRHRHVPEPEEAYKS